MDVLSSAYFDDTITAASKIRATTGYALPAVGAANTAYISGNYDAYVPVGQYASGVRPGYGFYAAGVLGTYLYAETGAELRLRTNNGQEYTMWNSGNSRSDAQNDSRYSQLGHTHAIADVTGLQTALDAKATVSGTVGRLAKIGSGNTLVDSIVTELASSIRVAGTISSDTVTADVNARGYTVLTNGLGRWITGKAGSETGSNAGSDFVFWRLDDAGSYLGEALRLSRANGNATFSGTITASGGNSTNWNTAFSWGNHSGLYVPTSRTVTAGTGLTGGGALSANITLSFDTAYGDGRYAALSHIHAIADVTGLQTALDGKATASGTVGKVPKFATANSFTDSIITEVSSTTVRVAGVITSDTITADVNARGLTILTGGVGRWIVGKAGSETGSNAGSDWVFWRLNDSGVYLGEAMRLSRANGNATFAGTITASGGNSTNWNTAFSWGNHASAGYVSTSRTLTINGTTFDLSANRSWTIAAGVGGSGTANNYALWITSSTVGSGSLIEDASYVMTEKGLRAGYLSGGPNRYIETYHSPSGAAAYFLKPGASEGWMYGYLADDFYLQYFHPTNPARVFTFKANGQFASDIPTGVAPFSLVSTTMSPNLNADMVDGLHASSFALASSLSGYVPTSRTLTINGTAFDLSANRSWTISGGISGTAGKLAKIGTGGNTIVDSIVTELSTSIQVAGTITSDTVTADTNARGFTVLTGGVGRWIVGKAGSETGSNAGSDWVFWRLNDSGVYLGEAMRLSRANGNATFAGTITASGGNSGNWNTAFSWGNHASAGYALNSALSGYVPTSRTITINGTTFDLSANRSWTISAGGSTTLAGLSDVGISGLANWQSLVYFNGQWKNINLNSVDSTYVDQGDNNVMTWANSQFVPLGRTITINGTTYDLSANRTWTISAGISGSGNSNNIMMWNGSTSATNSALLQSLGNIYVGGVSDRYNIICSGSVTLRSMSAAELASYTPPAEGSLVYQYNGTSGVYVYTTSSGWVRI